MRYPALIDGRMGAYGLVFPDLPGVVAMGSTVEEVIANGAVALQEYAHDVNSSGEKLAKPSQLDDVKVPTGCALTSILVIPPSAKRPRARLSFNVEADVADLVTMESRRLGMSKNDYLEYIIRQVAKMGV